MQPYEMSLVASARAVRVGELSPRELVASVLQRIELVEPEVGAFAEVMAETALRTALERENEVSAGKIRGPLHGVPVTVKDLFDVTGVATTASSRVRTGPIPARDSGLVGRLRDAGAIVLGKVHTHEFGMGPTTPTTRNPVDLKRIPGGSSGGSAAAVGSLMGALSFGSDTGGSIRIPAALCGVVGLKPSPGMLPMSGAIPLAPSLDTAGPLARSVADVAYALEAAVGFDADDPASVDAHLLRRSDVNRGLVRIGLLDSFESKPQAPEVSELVQAAAAALRDAGYLVEPAAAPRADLLKLQSTLTAWESLRYHRPLLGTQAELYTDEILEVLRRAESVTDGDYLGAQVRRGSLRAQWLALFERVDVLVTHTVPQSAARCGQRVFAWQDREEYIGDAYVRNCVAANLFGLPAVSIPWGRFRDKLPAGVQVIGRPYEDHTVLRIAQVLEEVERANSQLSSSGEDRSEKPGAEA